MNRLRRAWRLFVDFLGWWIPTTMALQYSVFGWFAPLFPEPWYVIPVSAVVAFVGVVAVYLYD